MAPPSVQLSADEIRFLTAMIPPAARPMTVDPAMETRLVDAGVLVRANGALHLTDLGLSCLRLAELVAQPALGEQ